MISVFLSFAGLALLWYRWRSRRFIPEAAIDLPENQWPLVSVIIPARNESRALPLLLNSLRALDYPCYEVIVVDDRSEDGTADIVGLRPEVRLVRGQTKPSGWGGKQWACQQGADVAKGEIFVFTDADTEHRPDSLRRVVAKMIGPRGSGMVSALPFHLASKWWEKAMGPFHVLLLTLTDPAGKPKPRRVYAIGQYLAFAREAYLRLGGHASVRGRLVEDLPLAQRCLEQGISYSVLCGEPLFQVRMYETLGDFLRGWRRNFRAGLGMTTPLAVPEAALIIAAWTGAGYFLFTPLSAICMLLSLALVVRIQSRLGAFPGTYVLFFPFSLLLFCLVTGLALADMVMRRPMVWKGRAYPA